MKKKENGKIALIRKDRNGKIYILFPEESSEGFCLVGTEKITYEVNQVMGNYRQSMRMTEPASIEEAENLMDAYQARGVQLNIKKKWVPKRTKK